MNEQQIADWYKGQVGFVESVYAGMVKRSRNKVALEQAKAWRFEKLRVVLRKVKEMRQCQ